MNLFYHPDILPDSEISFDDTESQHISRVLRKNSGDLIDLTNGNGIHAKAELTVTKKNVTARILELATIPRRKQFLELALAPTKNNERTEWFVEKAVEIGIEKITLIHCKNSERNFLKTERLHKVAISAMKQSLQFYLPEIMPPLAFDQWLLNQNSGMRCLAHCQVDAKKKLFQLAIHGHDHVVIAIGPEGDFDPLEIKQASDKGFQTVSLGESRLRTETAALAAVHTFELVNQVL